MRRRQTTVERKDERLAWGMVAPALSLILVVSLAPIAATFWESLHSHDLRLPWLGQPFIGLDNFREAARDARLGSAVLHTVTFAVVSVPIELALGLVLALVMHGAVRARRLVRVTALLPWAIPTVVGALVWRFLSDARSGIVTESMRALGLIGPSFDWLVDPLGAWMPIIAADVWRTTPFVAILLLAGLQTIDPALHEAARIDGAGPVRRFTTITLPLLGPAMAVAGAFRALDALRVFDLVYVLTGGGPGNATEPIALHAFTVLTEHLRFGYGSALSVIVFLVTFAVALLWVRVLGRSLIGERA